MEMLPRIIAVLGTFVVVYHVYSSVYPKENKRDKAKRLQLELKQQEILDLLKNGPKSEHEVKTLLGDNLDTDAAILFLSLSHDINVEGEYPEQILSLHHSQVTGKSGNTDQNQVKH